MGKKKKIPEKYQVWIDTRKRYRLSDGHIQMARELGLNPKKFGKIANHKQEPWKAPLPDFIEDIYFKRFGKTQPDQIKSIEQVFKEQERKKAERRARKQLKKQGEAVSNSNGNLTGSSRRSYSLALRPQLIRALSAISAKVRKEIC